MAAHWSEVPKRAKEAGLSPEGKKSKKGGGGEAGATAEDAADEDEEMRPDKFSTDVTSLLGADGGPQLNKLYKYLLMACAKGVVRHERILRELQAASNIYVWKATEEHPLHRPLKRRYGEYIEEVKKLGKEHKLGGPQGMLLLELLELLTEEPGRATITEEQKRETSEYRDEIRALTSEEVMERHPRPQPRATLCRSVTAHRARGSAATDKPRASATSCAIESCDATEIRCVANT